MLTDAQSERIASLAKQAGKATSGNRAYMPPDREPLLELAALLLSVDGPWLQGWHARWPSATRLVSSDCFAAALVLLLAHGNSVADAIETIERVLTSTTPVVGSLWIAVRGPSVTSRVELGEGVSIGRADDFPRPGRFLWDDRDLLPQSPTCCIRTKLEPEIPFGRAPLASGWVDPDRPWVEDRSQDGWEVASLLGALMFPVPVRILAAGFTFDSPLLNLLSGCEYWQDDLPPHADGQSAPTVEPLKADVSSAWSALRRCGKGRDAVLLACDRIARYTHQRRLQDKCLEACISLEALFAGEGRDAATYKAIRRCVRFLRAGLEDRKALSKDLTRVMNLRGKVAHGSSLRPLPRSASPKEVGDRTEEGRCVEMLARSVAEAILKILALGYLPQDDEWDYREWG